MITLFTSLTDKDKTMAVEKLIVDSTPNDHFFLMIILAVCMATFGLLSDNSIVIIGSMLIAPLLSPIMSLSMGVVMSDAKLLRRSSLTVAKSLLYSVAAATLVTLLFSPLAGLDEGLNREIAIRAQPDVVAGIIALIAGLAASFALIKPQLSASLPGIVISVSLIPPLAVSGIGLGRFNWNLTANSFIMFLLNATCIVFASIVVFSLMRLSVKKRLADHTAAVEDDKLEADKLKANHQAK